jgi:hypothetical protein
VTRPWKNVKVEKTRRDKANGRDVKAARAETLTRTQAYVLGFQLTQLHQQLKHGEHDQADGPI